MKKRYIGPENPEPVFDEAGQETGSRDAGHEVLVAGNKLGNVRHGDVLDVPDDLAQEVAWPEALWEDVKAPAPRRSAAGANATTNSEGDN